ncbi:MAG: L-lactate dehydrogenase [Rhizobiales bacterium]|nr:L-lactate dehydrogenase [Hyphomicrobiales bacterium]
MIRGGEEVADIESLACVEDYRRLAEKKLPRILFDYIDGGSYAEETLARNVEAFGNVHLTQRVMINVANPDTRVTLFGQTLPSPLICAPVGFAGMYARRGEAQAARAAKSLGIPFCLSTVGICGIEEVTAAAEAPWFQLYMIRDRDWLATLLQRATKASCRLLVLTADLQTPGTRYRDIRSGMMRNLGPVGQIRRAFEGMLKMGWTYDVFLRGRPHSFGNLAGVLPPAASFATAWQWIGANFDPTVTWDDLAFIREHWKGPIILKGVMHVDDARLARDHGLEGIVVSNHGGRQLDGGQASLAVLPEIARAVGDEITVLMDGGVRSGIDVVKAINMGARACMIGRPWAYALAAGGQAGVARMLAGLQAEIRTAQALSARLTFS